jgi:hypothetical protein
MQGLHEHSRSERGATLMTTLIFLAVVSILSVTSMRAGRIGVRMSQNEEARFSALETAQGLTETITGRPALTPVVGVAGFSICTPNVPNCNLNNMVIPPGYLADQIAAGHLSARVERLTPEEKPPPRLTNSSIDKFSAASFEVTATFDRTDESLGRVELSEGVLVLIPKS